MHVLDIDNGIRGYGEYINYILRYGARRTPRGLPTLDVGPMCVIMRDTRFALPLHIGRNVNRKIAAAEAIQLIGGFSAPQLLINASKNFAQFMEPGTEKFHGAYGTRISTQLFHIVRKLKEDRDTRQAVITLWDPKLDNEVGKRDYPCTVMLHFAIMDDKLDLSVVMRSQDAWLGTPFDWFQFTQLQWTIARILKLPVGVYRHTTLSTHIYMSNLSGVENLTHAPNVNKWETQPTGLGPDNADLIDVMWRAFALSKPNSVEILQEHNITDSERWYCETLAPIVG